jgi:hypothetical protein
LLLHGKATEPIGTDTRGPIWTSISRSRPNLRKVSLLPTVIFTQPADRNLSCLQMRWWTSPRASTGPRPVIEPAAGLSSARKHSPALAASSYAYFLSVGPRCRPRNRTP